MQLITHFHTSTMNYNRDYLNYSSCKEILSNGWIVTCMLSTIQPLWLLYSESFIKWTGSLIWLYMKHWYSKCQTFWRKWCKASVNAIDFSTSLMLISVLCSRYIKGHGQCEHKVIANWLKDLCLHLWFCLWQPRAHCPQQRHKHKKNTRLLYPYAYLQTKQDSTLFKILSTNLYSVKSKRVSVLNKSYSAHIFCFWGLS